MGIFKKGAESGMTKKQQEKFDDLIKNGQKDVAGAYLKQCEEENYDEEFKERLNNGRVEGRGMNLEEL